MRLGGGPVAESRNVRAVCCVGSRKEIALETERLPLGGFLAVCLLLDSSTHSLYVWAILHTFTGSCTYSWLIINGLYSLTGVVV